MTMRHVMQRLAQLRRCRAAVVMVAGPIKTGISRQSGLVRRRDTTALLWGGAPTSSQMPDPKPGLEGVSLEPLVLAGQPDAGIANGMLRTKVKRKGELL